MTDGVAPVTTRADPALEKALARAFRYQRMLDEGQYAVDDLDAWAESCRRVSTESPAAPRTLHIDQT
jgi:hypothetical protein